MIQSDLPLEMSVVSPQPHMMEKGTAAHVLLVQAPVAEWSTTLVTVCEPAPEANLWRIAVTTPEHIMYNHVINAVFPSRVVDRPRCYNVLFGMSGTSFNWVMRTHMGLGLVSYSLWSPRRPVHMKHMMPALCCNCGFNHALPQRSPRFCRGA